MLSATLPAARQDRSLAVYFFAGTEWLRCNPPVGAVRARRGRQGVSRGQRAGDGRRCDMHHIVAEFRTCTPGYPALRIRRPGTPGRPDIVRRLSPPGLIPIAVWCSATPSKSSNRGCRSGRPRGSRGEFKVIEQMCQRLISSVLGNGCPGVGGGASFRGRRGRRRRGAPRISGRAARHGLA